MAQGYAQITNPPVGISGNQYTTLLNTNLQALVTKHSGTTAPSSPQTYQDWMDTTSAPYVHKVYDGTDWIIMGYLDPTLNTYIVSFRGTTNNTGTSHSIANTDREKLVTFSNGSAVACSLAQAGTSFPDGWKVYLRNKGAGLVTITPTTSTIDGAATLTLAQNQSIILVSDGTNYYTIGTKGLVTATTAVSGIVLLADQTKMDTGSNSTDALTANLLAAWDLTSNKRFDPVSNNVSDSSGTATIDLANGDVFDVTLTGTGRTLANPSNMRVGACIVLRLTQDGTGNRTITTYGGFWKFPNGTLPTLDSTAGAIMYIVGYVETTSLIRAVFRPGY